MEAELIEALAAIDTKTSGLSLTLIDHGKDLGAIRSLQAEQNGRITALEHAKSEQKGYDRAKAEDADGHARSTRTMIALAAVGATVFGGIVAAGVGAGVALL